MFSQAGAVRLPRWGAWRRRRGGVTVKVSMPMQSENEIMTRYYECDNSAFEELEARYGRRLRAYFWGKGVSGDVVEDLCQLVWIKLVSTKGSPREFDPPVEVQTDELPSGSAEMLADEEELKSPSRRFDARRPFNPWLFRIASNELVSFWRRNGRIREHESTIEDPFGENRRGEELLPSKDGPIDSGLLQDELSAAVASCYKTLPSVEHDVLWHWSAGATLEDIGRMFGRNTVWAFRTRNKAIAMMQKALQASGYEVPSTLGPARRRAAMSDAGEGR